MAADLGAPPGGIVRRVLLPQLAPAIGAAAAVVFAGALGEFVIVQALVGTNETRALGPALLGARQGPEPRFSAIGAVLAVTGGAAYALLALTFRAAARGTRAMTEAVPLDLRSRRVTAVTRPDWPSGSIVSIAGHPPHRRTDYDASFNSGLEKEAVVPVPARVLEANARFAETFDKGDAQLPPNLPLAVLTCIDARLHPASFLGLEIGDAHVIRNAGGRATDDALRSLIVSSQLLGTREFMVIHHTDCGMLTFTNEDIWSKLQTETGTNAEAIDFMPFSDVEESLKEDVKTIRENPFLPKDDEVTGWVYDVKTGRLREVAVT
jgi:carbonic anhydrase